jgi:hypothetical protein
MSLESAREERRQGRLKSWGSNMVKRLMRLI